MLKCLSTSLIIRNWMYRWCFWALIPVLLFSNSRTALQNILLNQLRSLHLVGNADRGSARSSFPTDHLPSIGVRKATQTAKFLPGHFWHTTKGCGSSGYDVTVLVSHQNWDLIHGYKPIGQPRAARKMTLDPGRGWAATRDASVEKLCSCSSKRCSKRLLLPAVLRAF